MGICPKATGHATTATSFRELARTSTYRPYTLLDRRGESAGAARRGRGAVNIRCAPDPRAAGLKPGRHQSMSQVLYAESREPTNRKGRKVARGLLLNCDDYHSAGRHLDAAVPRSRGRNRRHA